MTKFETIKLNSFIFPESLIEKMVNSIILSNDIDQEIGFVLCAKDNIVHDRFHCEDEKCSSIRELKCESGEIPIGFFHAYPYEKRGEVLDQDIELGYKYGVIVAGGIDEIFFMIRKEDYRDEVYQEIRKIINENKELDRETENLLLELQSHMDILELQLSDIEELKRRLIDENISGIPLRSVRGEFILSVDIIQNMIASIEKSKKIFKEVGLELCGANNIVITRNECIGEESCIRGRKGICEPGEVLIGGFHAHTSKNARPSLSDLSLVAYGPGVECIGSRTEIKCFIKRQRSDQEYLEKLSKTKELIMEEENRIRKEKDEFGVKHFKTFVMDLQKDSFKELFKNMNL